MGHVAIGEGVHVLDEDALRGEVLEHDGQGTADIGADETDHVGDLHGEVLFLQDLVGLVGVRHDTTQDAEVGVVGNRHGGKVNTGSAEGFCHFGQTTRFVLEEHGELFCFHIYDD